MKDVVASRLQDDTEHERECLHCQMQELVENYFATNDESHPSIGTDVVVVDGYEVLDAIAMLVADVTCCVSIADRHQLLRYLIRGIKLYDGESRSRKDDPDSRSLN